MKQQFDTVIVGAGASGLIAALEAAKGGQRVLILERMDAPGKKILATGNGKCNMTNLDMEGDCYRGSGQALARYGISKMPPEKLRRYFYDLGLFTMERDGYVYPVTEQAKTVVTVLRQAVKRQQVTLHNQENVTKILPAAKGSHRFEIETDKAAYLADQVVLAAGGKASPNLGSNGSGYDLAKSLGCNMKTPLPALTALTSPKTSLKGVAGVRTKGSLTLWIDGRPDKKQRGEIQFTAYGISGIPVFQLSRYAVEALEHKKSVEARFDFFPDLDFGQIRSIIRDFRKIGDKTGEVVNAAELFDQVLGGLLHEKWIPILQKELGISKSDAGLSEKTWNQLAGQLKDYPIPIDGYRGFEFAQACQGGVDGAELTNEMESKKIPGLYLVGELVDVDGTCGGYNLHWAFTSGYLAGQSIARKQGRSVEQPMQLKKPKETKGQPLSVCPKKPKEREQSMHPKKTKGQQQSARQKKTKERQQYSGRKGKRR